MITLTYRHKYTDYTITASDDRVTWKETSEQGRKRVQVTANCPITLLSVSESLFHPIGKDDRILANGYQSWTETKEFLRNERLNDLDLLPKSLVKRFAFKAYGSQSFTPMDRTATLSFDYMMLYGENPLFIGSHNYRNAFLLIRVFREDNRVLLVSDVRGKRLQANEPFTVLDYTLSEDAENAKKAYFDGFKPLTTRKLFGYTSWYNHYQNISEEIIEKALDHADKRFDLFQIDDGFEPFVGDWMETDLQKFPGGLNRIVNMIHGKGMLAGIWLAPFVAERKSSLVVSHPEYIKHNEKGEPIIAGSNWSSFCPLDLDNDDAVEYIRSVLRQYVSLGFDFFKLDFLYAACLSRKRGYTRAETAEFAYGILREELKGKMILGCGATLSSGFERFDYMRIGPDVSLKFDDEPYMRLFHPERISTKVTLCNTIFRRDLNGRAFGNDPDVFLLRDDNIKLSKAQRYALTIINALFGSLLMTSDDPSEYDAEKAAILDKALDLNRNAENITAERKKNRIEISYTLRGTEHFFRYDMKKGIISDER